MPTIPYQYDHDELMRILRSYGNVSFYCNAYDEMNMCRVVGIPTTYFYDHAFGGYQGTDMEAAQTSYNQLYLTVHDTVWEIESEQ